MPGRYLSDTTARCQTITQTRFFTTYVDSCWTVPGWPLWNPWVIRIGNATVTPVGTAIHAVLPDPSSMFYISRTAVPSAINHVSLLVESVTNPVVISVIETVDGQEVVLGEQLLQSAQMSTVSFSITPSTPSIRIRVRWFTAPAIMRWRTICVQVPQMQSETYLVDVCDEVGDKYRFGFNGGEKTNEIAGIGNYVDLGERGVDSRIARLNWRPDPRTVEYPWQSPYAYHRNSPIVLADYLGGGDPPNFNNVSTIKNVAQNSSWADYSNLQFEPGRVFRGEVPFFNNCWHSARDQINMVNSNYKPQLDNQRVNMYQHKDQSKKGTQTAVNLQTGVDIIVKNLKQGLPVMVGVMYDENKNTKNSNRATNHYINVVGMGNDIKGVYFSYYDNYGGEEKGTNLKRNKFYYSVDIGAFIDNTNPPIGDDKTYIMTEVRDNERKPEQSKELSPKDKATIDAYKNLKINH